MLGKLWLLLLSAVCLGVARAEDAPPPSLNNLPPAMVVLDASRSMWAKIGPTSKVGLLRIGIGKAVDDYRDKVAFGLVAFGHRPAAACSSAQVLAKPGELTSDNQSKLLFGFKPQGDRPLAASLEAAAEAAQSTARATDLVLITDSGDGCKADICTTAQALKQTAPNLRIHVLAFATKIGDDVNGLSCLAEVSGGQFLTATNADELKQRLTTIFASVAQPRAPAVAVTSQLSPAPVPAPQAAAPSATQVPAPTAAPSAMALPAQASPAPQSEAQRTPALPETNVPKSAAPPPQPTSSGAASASSLVPSGAVMPVPVTFKALLTDGGPKLQSGLTWRVFSGAAGQGGKHKLLSTHREAMPTAALMPGEYLVNAAYGLSNLTKKIKVESGKSLEETFVLNTGGLKLGAVLANGEPLPPESVHFEIMSDEEDQFGKRHAILGNAKPGIVIRLNAGAYHIVSLYGDANATVRADVTVEPGKLTEATVKHSGSKVTFKLVQNTGGEALADTQWTILTNTGDVVKETAGALPSYTLAAGSYAVVARHAGQSYTRSFEVSTGDAQQIEVVMEEGPASPEALRAVANPAPPSSDKSTASPASPGRASPSPDSGMAFGGGEGAPRTGGGLFLNPIILLHPKFN
jgi:hypothetical protein